MQETTLRLHFLQQLAVPLLPLLLLCAILQQQQQEGTAIQHLQMKCQTCLAVFLWAPNFAVGAMRSEGADPAGAASSCCGQRPAVAFHVPLTLLNRLDVLLQSEFGVVAAAFLFPIAAAVAAGLYFVESFAWAVAFRLLPVVLLFSTTAAAAAVPAAAYLQNLSTDTG